LDVCWEPPVNTPVTNPADDFPITANQPEMFEFKTIYNNGEPITYNCCNLGAHRIEEGRVEMNYWYLLPDAFDQPNGGTMTDSFFMNPAGSELYKCNSPDPEHIRCATQVYMSLGDGDVHQCIGYGSWYDYGPGEKQPHQAYDIFEVVIDLD
ncbi:hypothetical protein KAU08_05705, partial [bacterium]|nr:hypothetical protein [bacterium]